MRSERRELLLILLLAAAPLLAYAPAWREGRLLAPGDGAALHLPLRSEVFRAWQRGEVPSWNGSIFSGTPLLASYRPGALHPLMLALAPLPPLAAFQLLVLVSLALTGPLRLPVRPAARSRAGGGAHDRPRLRARPAPRGPSRGHRDDRRGARVAAAAARRGEPPGAAAARARRDARPRRGRRARAALRLAAAVLAAALLLGARLVLAFLPRLLRGERRRRRAHRQHRSRRSSRGCCSRRRSSFPRSWRSARRDAGGAGAADRRARAARGRRRLRGALRVALARADLRACPRCRCCAACRRCARRPRWWCWCSCCSRCAGGPDAGGPLPLAFDLALAVLAGLALEAQWRARREPLGRRVRQPRARGRALRGGVALGRDHGDRARSPRSCRRRWACWRSRSCCTSRSRARATRVYAHVFLLPLVVSFLLQPLGRQAWAGRADASPSSASRRRRAPRSTA